MLLAQQDSRPLFEITTAPLFEDTGIPLALMGIFVVFMALVLVSTFISILPHALRRISPAPPQAETPAPVSAGEIPGDEISPETVAIIAAAVTAVSGGTQRVIKIRGLTPEDLGWSLEGRMQQHHSHKPQQRNRS